MNKQSSDDYYKIEEFIRVYSNNEPAESIEFSPEISMHIIKAKARGQFNSETVEKLLDALIKHAKDCGWPDYAYAIVGLLLRYGYKEEFEDKYHEIKEAADGEELKESLGILYNVCNPRKDLYLMLCDY